ncbi:adenylosuccinate synthetase [Parabacteroides goldsteinii]|uniref:adenylosuccinate synthetase n=1 Tax=Parabacteroides goldsteinii TaxID=328812 RepID=UPI0025B25FF7|nr:adenylosuccinate synthetase [Parabacteroides goldsteinii]
MASKYGCRLQGTTDVAFTVLDVLGYLDEIPICVGYEIDGEVTTDFPVASKLSKAKPVLKKFPGLSTMTSLHPESRALESSARQRSKGVKLTTRFCISTWISFSCKNFRACT